MRWTLILLLALAPIAALQAKPAEEFGYVLYSGKDRSSGSFGSGYGSDWRRAKSLQQGSAPLFYVRQNGAAYVIRDAGVIARAQEILRPQQELGRQQAALGDQQGQLGEQQSALGEQQALVGRQIATMTMRRSGDVGARMNELGRAQVALGARQAALGKQQAALGREQALLAAAARPQLEALVADAIRRGLARPVN